MVDGCNGLYSVSLNHSFPCNDMNLPVDLANSMKLNSSCNPRTFFDRLFTRHMKAEMTLTTSDLPVEVSSH